MAKCILKIGLMVIIITGLFSVISCSSGNPKSDTSNSQSVPRNVNLLIGKWEFLGLHGLYDSMSIEFFRGTTLALGSVAGEYEVLDDTRIKIAPSSKTAIVLNYSVFKEQLIFNDGKYLYKRFGSKSYNLQGKIIFSNGEWLYMMNADGINPNNIASGDYPAYSADGAMLAYISRSNDGTSSIMIKGKGTNGSIFSEKNVFFNLTISPDGTRLAFQANNNIYMIDSDGRNKKLFLNSADYPAWSPDGKKIALTIARISNNNAGISIINIDGTNQKVLANGYYPAWSPDGGKIAFISSDEKTICSINADGSNQKQLAKKSDNSASNLAWSPDGSKIAFTVKGQIYIMDADGNNQIPISSMNTAGQMAWATTSAPQ